MGLPVAAQWYDAEQLTHGVTWIDEPHSRVKSNIWLVPGKERNLVFDPGTGMGPIANTVAEMVEGEVIAVASTGYFDHAGGLNQFESRAVHRLERERLAHPTLRNMVIDKYWKQDTLKALPRADFEPSDYRVPGCEPTRLLDDGDVIDLGDRQLEVIHTPGITDGSLMLYEAQHSILFGGETLSDGGEFYTGEPADYTDDADPKAHVRSMRRVCELQIDTVFPGHGSPFDGRRLGQILDEYFNARVAPD